MPDIDASIPLGYKAPDQMKNLAGLLSVAKGAQDLQTGAQTLQQSQQKTQQGGIDLQERQAMQQVLSDPANYTDEGGNFNLQKAQSSIMRAAPTTGVKYMNDLSVAHQNATSATSALNTLTAQNRSQIGSTLASLPENAAPELVNKTVDALGAQFGGRIDPLVKVFKQQYDAALQKGGPQAGRDFILQSARSVLPQETQQTMDTPAGATLDNGQQSTLVNLKPGVPGMPQGTPVPGTQVQKLLPVGQQESTITDAQGNLHVQQRDAFGNIIGTRPLQASQPGASGPFTLPANETAETLKDMQGQRSVAQSAAVNAPVLHDINRTIVQEANKGLNTGSLGALTQRVASATGYNLAGESATDYNLLGKMLERSALTAAQGMGPHTNAGLEAAVRANGSLEYTPQAIKKIAYLNDAIVSGSELYHQGLEKAIGSSQNGVFAKRQFDTEWGKVATPQVLRLKNAVDNGNQEEVAAITKEVGGRGSAGARKLHQQLTQMLQLTGQ